MSATEGQNSVVVDSAAIQSPDENGQWQTTERLKHIIDSTPAVLYMLVRRNGWFDTDFVSTNIEQQMGHPSDSVLGGDRWWRDTIHPADRDRASQQLEQWLENGAPGVLKRQYRLRHGDGQYRWFADWMQSAGTNADGHSLFVGSLSEVSDPVTLTERLSQLSSVMPGMIYQYEENTDGQGRFPYVSDGSTELFGLAPGELQDDALPLLELVHEADLDEFRASINESSTSLREWRCEFRIVRDGAVCWVFGHAKPERTESGGTLWHGFMMDISERKALENELEHSRDVLRKAQRIGRLGHWQCNLDSGELSWSEILYEIFGVDPDSFTPTLAGYYDMVHPDDREALQDSAERARVDGGHDVVHRIIRPDGSVRWVHELADLQRSGAQQNIMMGTVCDITEQKELEIQLREQSISDELTGAWNRRYFIEQISREFDHFKRHQRHGAVILFDFDHFKHVNDHYGHAAGDQVLALSTGVLQRRLRSTDCLARIGGEEFAVLLPDTTLEQALNVAETLRSNVEEQEFYSDDDTFRVTITCGVATFSEADEAFENTMHRADKAMYDGKTSGRNRVTHI